MNLRQVIVALTAGMASAFVVAQTPPPGWRFLKPTDWQINDERVSLPMTRAEADFNGDGKTDRAFVLVHRADSSRTGVFVFAAGEDQAPPPQKLHEFRGGDFMLSAVRKGCYRSGYRSEKRTICLSNSGLLLSDIEFGTGTLYWQKNGAWRQIQIGRGEFEGL